MNLDDTNILVAFSVFPSVMPDTFTFTAASTNASAVVGYATASGATVGTYHKTWVGGPGSWSPQPTNVAVETIVVSSVVP